MAHGLSAEEGVEVSELLLLSPQQPKMDVVFAFVELLPHLTIVNAQEVGYAETALSLTHNDCPLLVLLGSVEKLTQMLTRKLTLLLDRPPLHRLTISSGR